MIYFQLFYTFFLIGLMTFGGGYAMIPMIQDTVVGNGWMTLTELTDFIAISEATPGPFAINIATFVGNKVGGVLGSVCTTLVVVLPSFIIILLVAFVLSKFINNKYVKGALNGVRPVITVYKDKSFEFITKVPPMAVLIKKAAGIQKGSGKPNKEKVAKLTKEQVRAIAEQKMPDLNAASIEAAMSMIAGTARSMGVTVEE